MTKSKHPAILKFPAQADRISERIRNDIEFAGICLDYAQIVDEIACKERPPGRSRAVLAELLQLKFDLENDIVDMLSEAEGDSAVSGQNPSI